MLGCVLLQLSLVCPATLLLPVCMTSGDPDNMHDLVIFVVYTAWSQVHSRQLLKLCLWPCAQSGVLDLHV